MAELSTIARPYARAVFEIARDQGDYAGWSDKLAFLAAVATDAHMQALIEGPRLTDEQKADVFLAVVGDELDEAGTNLIRLMSENHRLPTLPEVSRLYEEYRREAEGRLEVQVIAARRLETKDENAIATALKTMLGRDVKITSDIDQDLIGGAIVRAGDLVIDGSLRGRLEKLATTLGR
jgi:F-type H+-transporting ATPase subunit delta